MAKNFLQAEWRKLAMANYVVDPAVLKAHVPYGTELDFWNGRCYASLVGFRFIETRMLGMRIPFHADFEEVNLRFYVRFREGSVWKRGVVFISEIVPLPALSLVANLVYGEHYETMPMRHRWTTTAEDLTVEYRWKKKSWNTFSVVTTAEAFPILPDSEEEFITEHYWGYTRIAARKTSEYEVVHPRWDVYETKHYSIDVDFENIYTPAFGFLKDLTPASVFVAEGSAIAVKQGTVCRY